LTSRADRARRMDVPSAGLTAVYFEAAIMACAPEIFRFRRQCRNRQLWFAHKGAVFFHAIGRLCSAMRSVGKRALFGRADHLAQKKRTGILERLETKDGFRRILAPGACRNPVKSQRLQIA